MCKLVDKLFHQQSVFIFIKNYNIYFVIWWVILKNVYGWMLEIWNYFKPHIFKILKINTISKIQSMMITIFRILELFEDSLYWGLCAK